MFSDFSLDQRLLKALEAAGWEQPTDVQTRTIPVALTGKDLMVSAETGSGKTGAFLLPMLNRLLTPAPNTGTRALILLPTRELARQVFNQCELLATGTGIKAGLITGGDDFKYQASLFRKNPEIIVSTPGRLVDHVKRGTTDFRDLEVLVLDEADRMLDMGFSEDVLKIAAECTFAARQTLLFSATLQKTGLKRIVTDVLREPESILVNPEREQHGNIRQQMILVDDLTFKEKLLVKLLETETFDKALVFTKTRVQAAKLEGFLRYNKLRAGVLHGEISQEERNRAMELLRNGRINVLVATDLAARGLDVQGIDLVVNFDVARRGDDHVHRIGRTGRAGQQGLAVTFVSALEWNLMASIERYLNIRFERRKIAGMEASYKGPKKVKASGKAASRKKKKPADKKAAAEKGKQRLRDKKATGQRRKTPAGGATTGQGKDTGFEPPRIKKKPVTAE
ncbi:DEAD/DEAH box helicase [Kistimonas asteriae]|uniref:DEAD/DEAH box helicase n=1 Tax=Kistimonas asteriae TaxID=517724 RepID=UPI001BA73F02|nr:DEAD/DEAH box helicase [Kistimonas asteriae]